MGVAMRTNRWRFAEWRKPSSPNIYELYDYQNDPQENENLAGKPEYSAVVKELAAMLHGNLKASR